MPPKSKVVTYPWTPQDEERISRITQGLENHQMNFFPPGKLPRTKLIYLLIHRGMEAIEKELGLD